MPVKVKKVGDKFRIIEANTGKIAKDRGGKSFDKGGFKSKATANKHASGRNIGEARQRGAKIPKRR